MGSRVFVELVTKPKKSGMKSWWRLPVVALVLSLSRPMGMGTVAVSQAV